MEYQVQDVIIEGKVVGYIITTYIGGVLTQWFESIDCDG